MGRFKPTLDIWTLTPAERSLLPIGQWVKAGPDGPQGPLLWRRTVNGCRVAWEREGTISILHDDRAGLRAECACRSANDYRVTRMRECLRLPWMDILRWVTP